MMYRMWKIAETPTVWDMYDMQQDPHWDRVPIVSGYRKNKRKRIVHNFLSDKLGDSYDADMRSQNWGQLTSTLPVGAIAYFPGRRIMRKIPKLGLKGNKSGLIVSALAMLASYVGGRGVAALSPDRTMQQQYDATNRHNRRGLNWWVPGYAAYQSDMFDRYVDSIKDKHPRELIERRQALRRMPPRKVRHKDGK